MNSTYLWWFGLFGNVHPTVLASSKQIHAVQQTEGVSVYGYLHWDCTKAGV